MSEKKIKSKDLTYDSSLPPFLQRLHDRNAGRGDADRHERPLARPKKAKDPHEDDGPTVVDETGETLSKEEVAKLTDMATPIDGSANVKGDTDLDAAPEASGAVPPPEPDTQKGSKSATSNVTDGTAQKKRKAVKVVGDDDAADPAKELGSSRASKKVKKKAKVKLAFHDEG
ncbi:Hypothetical predicted protein [Lecanosticta acicola]|uniref:DUF4604 domain-containing protein n=1 Tax=Lecanosticta acicola TaxID=111012 RepID=A0AAI8YS17_9PEZI|nr:Hypothetical predicted protein [Lecanosticta acicola]